MASSEVTISGILVGSSDWSVREKCIRFLIPGTNMPADVGAIVFAPPSSPVMPGNPGFTTVTVYCYSTADAAAVTAGINSLPGRWVATQGSDT